MGELSLDYYEANPELPTVLTEPEIQELYKVCSDDEYGLRDRAILGLYYGCGLRRSEGVALDVPDVQFSRGLLYVRKGKGNKERYVPLAGKVAEDLRWYLIEARPKLLKEGKSPSLLISYQSRRPHSQTVAMRLAGLVETAGIPKLVGLHSLRHSIATPDRCRDPQWNASARNPAVLRTFLARIHADLYAPEGGNRP